MSSEMMRFEKPSGDKSIVDTTTSFTPKFDAHGLITAVVCEHSSKELLMVAHMNEEALAKTISTGIAHYYSRSRKCLWKKGETSGNLQTVQEILTDCDQDVLLINIQMSGDKLACHTERKSCFYRQVTNANGNLSLKFVD